MATDFTITVIWHTQFCNWCNWLTTHSVVVKDSYCGNSLNNFQIIYRQIWIRYKVSLICKSILDLFVSSITLMSTVKEVKHHLACQKINIEKNIQNIGRVMNVVTFYRLSLKFTRPPKKKRYRRIWCLWQFIGQSKIKMLQKNNSYKSTGYIINVFAWTCHHFISYLRGYFWDSVPWRRDSRGHL